ncbi:MAG: dephospho-CoA kinase [Pseudomonadota bacterium]
MIKAGLTGSIGMGKSTTADMFREEGIPVHDADATVHALYEGEAVPLVEASFPGTTKNGKVNRELLGKQVIGNPKAMKELEQIVHPLVHAREQEFLRRSEKEGVRLVVLDIPLLFETGGNARVDIVIVVSASERQQRERVLARDGMTEEKFLNILSKQVPDAEKRKRADYVIDTGQGMENARSAVRQIIAELDKNL